MQDLGREDCVVVASMQIVVIVDGWSSSTRQLMLQTKRGRGYHDSQHKDASLDFRAASERRSILFLLWSRSCKRYRGV